MWMRTHLRFSFASALLRASAPASACAPASRTWLRLRAARGRVGALARAHVQAGPAAGWARRQGCPRAHWETPARAYRSVSETREVLRSSPRARSATPLSEIAFWLRARAAGQMAWALGSAVRQRARARGRSSARQLRGCARTRVRALEVERLQRGAARDQSLYSVCPPVAVTVLVT